MNYFCVAYVCVLFMGCELLLVAGSTILLTPITAHELGRYPDEFGQVSVYKLFFLVKLR